MTGNGRIELSDVLKELLHPKLAGIANHLYGVRCGLTVISTGQEVAGEVKT